MMARLAEIKARLAAATPGPWENIRNEFIVCDYGVHGGATQAFQKPIEEQRVIADIRNMYQGDANGNLIAHAPSDLAYLLRLVDQFQEHIRGCCNHVILIRKEDEHD